MTFRDLIYSAEQDAWTGFDLRGSTTVSIGVRPLSDGAWPTSLVLIAETTIDGFEWTSASWIDEADGTESGTATFSARGNKRLVTSANTTRARVRVSTISTAAHDRIEVNFAGDGAPQRGAKNVGTGLSAGASIGGGRGKGGLSSGGAPGGGSSA